MNANDTIRLARKHCHEGQMTSSARLCLADALKLYERGELDAAKKRALDSLAYSVGKCHKDYTRAAK